MFLAPLFLLGLALASVPIIIHILNRRRFLTIEWPPMKYLKLTLRKNRRRIRIEQIILLAMRTLAVILLILAVARPVLSQTGLARLLPGRARTSRVIVIDDSMSMGYTVAGRTAFQVAQNAAEELIKSGGKQDSLTLLVTSSPNQPLVRDASMQESAKFADLVAGLTLTDTPSNWAAAFDGVVSAFTGATFSNKEVVVITDMRRAGWTAEVTALANKLAVDHVPVRFVDVGDRRTENAALLKFEMEDAIALPLTPIHLHAQVRNNTGAALVGTQATLNVDGDNRAVMMPELPAGATVDVPLTVSLENPGAHALSLSIGKDALPEDDTRYLVLTVRPTVSVMLVDGEPAAQLFESETYFLATAFLSGAKPWNVQQVTDLEAHRLRPGMADAPDVLVLANVAALTPEQVTAVEKLVDNGMGLMIFTGELIDPEFYNQKLFKDGKGLLPVKLERSQDTPTAGIVVEKEADSPLASLAKLAPEALARVQTRRYTGVVMPAVAPEGVSVLARWNNAELPPAVIEKKLGKGRVLLFTTTAGKKWTDWPVDPTYVLAVRSAALAVAQSQDSSSVLTAGDTIRRPLEEGQAALSPQMMGPDAKAADAVEIDKSSPQAAALRYTKTFHSGVYTMSWKDDKSKAVSQRFAVNPPASESDLEPLTESQLDDLLGNLKASLQRYDTSGVGLGTPPREIWRQLATILLGLMIAEAAFAVWVGRER